MPLKIFNRIFLSFILFVVLILFVFWFFYFRDVTANAKERINRAVTGDALVIEKEVNQFFSLRRSQIGILSEIAALKHFLHERGFLKTKVRGQLERDLIDFAASTRGVDRVRIVEPESFGTEPTILDVKRYKANLAEEDFDETLKVVRDPGVAGRYEASYDYATLKGNPFILRLVEQDDIAYTVTKAGERSYLSIGKAVKDRITGELTGILILDLSIPYLRDYFYRPSQSYIRDFAIRNANGRTIFEYNRNGWLSQARDISMVANYRLNLFASGAQEAVARNVGDLGISLVVDVDAARARRVWWRANLFMYVMFGVFALISIIVAYLLSKSIATPIRKLNRQVAQVDEEDPEPIAMRTKVAEIEQLTSTFNHFIDDLKRYKKESERKAHLAAIGQTTSMIAHDVRRPLAGIKAVLNILPEIKDDEHTLSKVVTDIERSVTQTNAMLNDILDFSRDSRALAIGKHNPQSIIVAAIGDVLKAKHDADVKFDYELGHKNALVVDGIRIMRVFSNIIANAVEAMNGKGRIWIRTADLSGPRISVVVGNVGPAIPEAVMDNLFDPFFTHEKKGGSGLGLAICRKIVDMHGGKIRVESRRSDDDEGYRTEFAVELPASEADFAVDDSELILSSHEFFAYGEQADERAEEYAAEHLERFKELHEERGKRSLLLIVDDEPLFRLSLRTMINGIASVKDAVKVVEADSAEMALELLKKDEFAYVISDIDLGVGRMNGFEFVHRVLNDFSGVHVMIHSNKRKSQWDEAADIMHPRFIGFKPKPMRDADVLQFLALEPFEAAALAHAAEDQKKKRVLVLNDDDAFRIALKFQLKAPDVEVLEAESVSDALKVVDDGDVSLVLADINLGSGEPDGYDFLKELKNRGMNIPVYMVSGYSAEDHIDRARKAGAEGYFQTPLDENAIKEIKQRLG